jgi:hypothetical protein
VNILVACERSGILRDALIAAGHNAISCDLEPSRRPGPHLQCDVRLVLDRPWDAMIAHPVCRYLTNAGVRWLHSDPKRWTDMRRADQFVHPWWFGSPFQKATGFHLTGLDPLPMERTKSSYAPGEIRQAVWLMGPSQDREEKRSETDPQVARAIAQYWFRE